LANLSAFKVLLPQGFYRQVKKNGSIIPFDLHKTEKLLDLFDLIIVSQKDYPQIESQAKEWSDIGIIAVVTKDSSGASVYVSKRRRDYTAFETEITDETGAGDVFAAAFANATAAYSLRFFPFELEYTKEQIQEFSARQSKSL